MSLERHREEVLDGARMRESPEDICNHFRAPDFDGEIQCVTHTTGKRSEIYLFITSRYFQL